MNASSNPLLYDGRTIGLGTSEELRTMFRLFLRGYYSTSADTLWIVSSYYFGRLYAFVWYSCKQRRSSPDKPLYEELLLNNDIRLYYDIKVAYPDITMPYPDYIVQSPATLLPYRDVERP